MDGARAEQLVSLAEQAALNLNGPERDSWVERLRRARPEFPAAIQWFVSRDEAEAALRLGGALWRFWTDEGLFDEGRTLLERALEADRAGDPTEPRRLALIGAGTLAFRQGDQAGAQPTWSRPETSPGPSAIRVERRTRWLG